MPRPVQTNLIQSVNTGAVLTMAHTAHAGHTIIIYADKAIWCETDGKFITPEDLNRKYF